MKRKMKFKKISIKLWGVALLFCLGFGSYSLFGAIDLVTTPERDSVELTIYNSADITMVREIRTLTFKKGLNTIQFAWSGTLIDPTSLRLTFKESKEDFDLLDTTFPANMKDTLQWNIEAKKEGKAKVEINYFTSGITWKADYVVLTNKDEKQIDFKGYVEVQNNSGEDYPQAKVRLVVGFINLIEPIRELAQRYGDHIRKDTTYQSLSTRYKKEAQRDMSKKMEAYDLEEDSGEGRSGQIKTVVKEGLSEYFIFTIEGKETIPHSWKKRMIATKADKVPVEMIYRYSERESASVQQFLEFRNAKVEGGSEELAFGQSPLPDGRYEVFRQDDKGNLSFIAGVNAKYIAVGEKMKLNLGAYPDIVLKKSTVDYFRENFVIEKNNFNNVKYVKYFDQNYVYKFELINSRNRKVKLEFEIFVDKNSKITKLPYKIDRVDESYIKFYPEIDALSTKEFTYQIYVPAKK